MQFLFFSPRLSLSLTFPLRSSLSPFFSEARQSNVLPSRSIRAHRSPPLTSKATRTTVPAPGAVSSAPPTAAAVSPTRSRPPPRPPVVPAAAVQPSLPPASLSVPRKKFAYMSPSNRSKSPPKMARPTDVSPKRSTTNDSINTDRLKQARDEAERAMKVSRKATH